VRGVTVLLAACLLGGPAARAAEGMPQLDFANPLMLAQIVWAVIIFVVLYRLLGGWALPQVEAVLAQRAAAIGADLEVAQDAKAKADAAVAELTAAARQAQAQAQAEVAAATTAARAEQASHAAELAAQLEQQLAEADRRIATARNDAMGALRDVAGEAATSLVTRLTGRTPEQREIEMAVADALAERR
jgi:F-type H+-transporting ATPase subunit b